MSLRDDVAKELSAPPPSQPFALIGWRPVRKGSLRGFASIRMLGRRHQLDFIDCPVCWANGHAWATLPSMPQVGRDGSPILDPRTGKPAWKPLAKWSDKAGQSWFSECVVALVIAAHGTGDIDGDVP